MLFNDILLGNEIFYRVKLIDFRKVYVISIVHEFVVWISLLILKHSYFQHFYSGYCLSLSSASTTFR